MVEAAPGRMPDDRNVAILASADETGRHLFARLPRRDMHRGDDDLELREHAILKIERSVGQNIDFARAERANPVARVEFVGEAALFAQKGRGHPVTPCASLRMVAD